MTAPILSPSLQDTLRQAYREAAERRHEYITLEHVLLALLDDAVGGPALMECGVDVKRLAADLKSFLDDSVSATEESSGTRPQHTLAIQRVMQRAAIHVLSAERTHVDGGHVLVELLREERSHAVFLLRREGLSRFEVVRYLARQGDEPGLNIERRGGTGQEDGGSPSSPGEGDSDPLEEYALDLIGEAAAGRIDPLIGREAEVERVLQILCRRRKNNPLLIGDPGVGKTAIAEGLALRIHEGKVPEPIQGAGLWSLDMGSLLAGTKFRGQFEERLKGVLRALAEKPRAVLFIDEIHTVVGAGSTHGSSMDASNLLKPALAGGRIRCIGSTTFTEYKGSIEKDHALARRFQKLEVAEPSTEEAVLILDGLREHYESFHQVSFSPDALRAAVMLSAKHLRDRALPDKAIDVLDEAGAVQRLLPPEQRVNEIGRAEVEAVVAKMARVPPESVSASDRERLRSLDAELKAVIFGQDAAVEALSSAMKLARSGLKAPERPVGSFLFSGPTGVGKTELAKQLARVLGVEFLRFDMSEYAERHSVSRLVGAPPGYVGYEQGGLLTDAIVRNPHSVLVLDEIEKAHPDLYNVLLQVMDHATLTDNNGRKADFRNVVLIMTTNAGARELEEKVVGFSQLEHGPDESRAKAAIERTFSPEFRNRLDAWIRFDGLQPAVILRVVDKEIRALEVQLRGRQVELHVSAAARDWLAEKGFDSRYGARPLARMIEQKIKKPLAESMLFGALVDGGQVEVDTDPSKDALRLRFAVAEEAVV